MICVWQAQGRATELGLGLLIMMAKVRKARARSRAATCGYARNFAEGETSDEANDGARDGSNGEANDWANGRANDGTKPRQGICTYILNQEVADGARQG